MLRNLPVHTTAGVKNGECKNAVSPGGHIILAMAKTRSGFSGLSGADAELMAAALVGYGQQRLEILEKMAELQRQIGGSAVRAATGSSNGARPARKKRTMSAAGRRRIAAAQRKRWAEFRKKKGDTNASK